MACSYLHICDHLQLCFEKLYLKKEKFYTEKKSIHLNGVNSSFDLRKSIPFFKIKW